MFKRKQHIELTSRIAEPRKTIQVLVGPRQVGKSTLVKQVLQEIDMPFLFANADSVDAEDRLWISQTWETARTQMQHKGLNEFLLVIDEVHKIDNWSEAVKKEWDSDTFYDVNLKVVLLGSSRLLLKDGLTESLAGRFELIRMPHWSYEEMHEAFGLTLDQYIYFGGYPGGAPYIRNEARWRRYVKDSIVAPAIDKDVLMTKTVYKPELMRRLFEVGATYSGEELSLNKVLGQLNDAGNVTTLANYLLALDESQLLAGLQKYAAGQARKYNSVPKFMVYNNALMSALSGSSFDKVFADPKLRGRWFESAVGAHLLNIAEENDYRIFYWRERDDEVDFIVQSASKCIAIEVKSGRRQANKGMYVFQEKFQPHRSLVVSSGGFSFEDFFSLDLERLFQ